MEDSDEISLISDEVNISMD